MNYDKIESNMLFRLEMREDSYMATNLSFEMHYLAGDLSTLNV